jgi:hypothetical protein
MANVEREFRSALMLIFVVTFGVLATVPSWGKGGFREEDYLISNGQGISSPSFWDGLNGENPAGLSYNSSLKVQGGAGAYDDDFSPIRGSGALILGNGLLGAGLEYSGYQVGPASNSGVINWGVGGYFSAIQTALGVSGHHIMGSSAGSYDIGALIDLGSRLRLGAMIPNFTNGVDALGVGLCFALDRSIDLVIDSALELAGSTSVRFKPGINFHLDSVQASAAYAPAASGGVGGNLISDGFTAGLGFRLMRSALISYEYQGSIQHRLGLTLKLN